MVSREMLSRNKWNQLKTIRNLITAVPFELQKKKSIKANESCSV